METAKCVRILLVTLSFIDLICLLKYPFPNKVILIINYPKSILDQCMHIQETTVSIQPLYTLKIDNEIYCNVNSCQKHNI